MHPQWLDDLDAFAQDEEGRRILLRIAALSRSGRTSSFLRAVELDRDLDEATKREVAELAGDDRFLRAAETYLAPNR